MKGVFSIRALDPWTAAVAACVAVVTCLAAHRMVTVARAQLTAAYDLASEGPQLASIALIRSGHNPYAAEVYDDLPFVRTFYTPIYFYAVAAFTGNDNAAFTARATSLACMTLAGLIPFLIGLRRAPLVGTLATAVFYLFWPVTINAAFAKNDSMALLLGAMAVCTSWLIPNHCGAFVAAALGVASFGAKQSFVTPLVAVAIYLFICDRRRLATYLVSSTTAVAVTSFACTLFFGQGFWASLLAVGDHPITFATFSANLRTVIEQPLFVVWVSVAALGLAANARVLISRPTNDAAIASVAYALFACVPLFTSLGKTGASTNYFLEPMLGLCMATVMSESAAAESSRYHIARSLFALLLCCGAVYDAVAVEPRHYDLTHASFNLHREQLVKERVALLRENYPPNPLILNLAGPACIFELPGRICLCDPYFQLLNHTEERLPVSRIITYVEARTFDVVVATPGILGWLADEQNNLTALLESVKNNYQIAQRHAGIVIAPRRSNGFE